MAIRRSQRLYLALGLIMVATLAVLALFPDRFATLSPYYLDAKSELVTQGTPPFPPGPHHLLGTDQYGRDIWSRIVCGTRWSLLFALLVMALRTVIAVPAALLAAYGPRLSGWIVERLYVWCTALPPILIYILLMSSASFLSLGLRANVTLTVLLLAVVEWPRLAVALRGRVEEVMAEEFIQGAVAVGSTRWRIFWVHVMPHLWPSVVTLMAAEVGRGLLTIAQLGVFGIWVGGGVQEVVYEDLKVQIWGTVSAVPEWGTMLADTRRYIATAPWMPVWPAMAFSFGIIGFQFLSQGLEGVAFSITRLRDRMVRWRWAVVLIVVGLVAGYFGGLPWGRADGIAALMRAKQAALDAGDVSRYLATLAPEATAERQEMRRWADHVFAQQPEVVGAELRAVEIQGNRATALLTLSAGYADSPPVTLTRNVTLVRRWNRWYDAGETLTVLQGMHVDVEANIDSLDPSRAGSERRYELNFLATAADHAFERVAAVFPQVRAMARPRVKLYLTEEAFRVTLTGEPNAATAVVWYTPGGAIRVSPALLKGFNRRDVEQRLTQQMLQYCISTATGKFAGLALITGSLELPPAGDYWIDRDALSLGEMRRLPELLAVQPGDVPGLQQPLFALQSALLAEMFDQATREQILARYRQSEDAWAPLLEATGKSKEAVAADYEAHIYKRLEAMSVLNYPAGRERIATALTDAVTAAAPAGATNLVLDMDGEAPPVTLYILQRIPGQMPHVLTETWVYKNQQWRRQGGGPS